MAQTKEGAAKVAAKYYGLTLDQYQEKIKIQKSCKFCKTWKNFDSFCKDKSSKDGLSKSCFECRRVKIKKCTKGRVTWMKGKKHTAEARLKISEAGKKRKNLHRIGATHTPECIARMKDIAKKNARRGPAAWNWKGGISPVEKIIRRSAEYKDWRIAVFTRDNFTCQSCKDNRGGNLQAHHIKGFAAYPKLRFVIENGLTLCEPCHIKEHQNRKEDQHGN